MDNKQIAVKLLAECVILSETLLLLESGMYHSSFEDRINWKLRRQLYRLMRTARIVDPECSDMFVDHLWNDVRLYTNEDGSSKLTEEVDGQV